MLFKSIKFQDKIWVTANINNIKKALIVSNHVLVKMDSLYKTGNFETNVEGSRYDAFRHIYWMYNLAKEIGIDKSRKIGLMYEDYNYYIFNIKPLSGYDLAGRTMDEYNNEVGLYLFSKIGKQETDEVFENIKDLISKGYVKIIAKDKNQNSLDKEGNVIKEEEWKSNWKNNRYLINSNVNL
jgi:glycosylphosphatidylinositol transamidase (GPIT) subunit GPI8